MHSIQQSQENHQETSQTSNQKQTESQSTKSASTIQAKQSTIQRKHKPPIQARQHPVQRKHKPPIQAKQHPIQKQSKAGTSTVKPNEAQIKHNVSVLKGKDVTQAKVHYNSSEPAKVNAAAYAQGTNVHLAPGQDHLMGHELTHVAQQMGGEVNAGKQANNGLVNINDDPKLEREADEIGAKASQGEILQAKTPKSAPMTHPSTPVIQRYMVYESRDQHYYVSEEDYNTIHTHTLEKDKEAYSDGDRYKNQMESFNKRYSKEKEKGKFKDRTKRKKEGWRHPQRKKLFVSDDGRMAVEHQTKSVSAQQSNTTSTGPRKSIEKNVSAQAWADETLIAQANSKLKANGAYVTLKTEASDLVVGDVPRNGTPNPSKSRFKKIRPIHIHNGKEEDMTQDQNMGRRPYGPYNSSQTKDEHKTLKLQDCGNANLAIMGAIQERFTSGIYERIYKTKGGVSDVAVNNPNDTIKSLIQQVMIKEFPDHESYKDIEKAYKAYKKIIKKQRKDNRKRRKAGKPEERTIDSAYGLNEHARPDLGQGMVTAAVNHDPSANGYNFHYATNIMQSTNGGDYMALEGIAPVRSCFKM